ncbi:unnamed protein product [Heterobilharzia americana]|nr:unnamed protein product [Heterobilharzia americana]
MFFLVCKYLLITVICTFKTHSVTFLDQLILVVEDITLQNSEDESIYELDAIPNYVFKAPRHLPPLFIKLCYNALE